MNIIISHQNTDFDALAAMLGARKLYPDHRLVLPSAVSPPVRRYLALHKDWLTVLEPAQIRGESIEEVVVVDTRDGGRLTDFAEALDAAVRVTVYDHHPPGDNDIEATRAVIEPVGSCATVLFERLEQEGVELHPREATLMMLGVYADTGSLSFPSTDFRDLRAAAYLRKSGASLPVVNRYLQQEFSPQQQRLLVALMNGIEVIHRDGLRVGIAGCTSADYVKGAAMVVERTLQLMGLDACFVALQQKGRDVVQVIGRSKTRHLDAAAVAAIWDGGGHRSAAAARARSADHQQVVDRLTEYVEQMELEPLEVGDIMSCPVQVVPHDMSLEQLKTNLERWGVSGVPVERDGRLDGVVSQRDVDKAASRGDWSVPAAGFMSHQVVTANPDDSIEAALEVMTDEDVGRLPVVDDEGEIIGIVSRSDILRRIYDDAGGGW